MAERLLRDALFFVAKSQTLDGRAAEVRATFGLDRYLPGRGLLDPEALARMRPVLDAMQTSLKAAHDSWQAYVDGDAEQLAQFQTHLERMQPQAQMVEASKLKPLLDELAAAAMTAIGRAGEARELVDLEVAATLLFMQHAVDQEDVLHTDFAARSEAQQARLRALIEGRELPANDMTAANQREAERDMLLHLAQEVGQNLKQMEEALDAFFRDVNEREALAHLPALSQQAQGALVMLELPVPASLLAAATAMVQSFASEGYPDEATQQRLADAFSSLGLYIEAYCAGRVDAARILRPVLIEFGVIGADSADEHAFDDTVEAGLPARKAEVQASYLAWRDHSDDDAKKKFLDVLTELGHDAELIDDAILKRQTRAALDGSRDAAEAPSALDAEIAALTGLALPERYAPEIPPMQQLAEPVAQASVPLFAEPALETGASPELEAGPVEADEFVFEAAVDTQPVPAVEAIQAEPVEAPAEGLLQVAIPEDVEAELLDIFLEEANEVLATLGEASEACHSNPDDQAALTVIRRGFHTLKGSGRMVGLNDLGETAWRHEQLMNGWLAEKKSASSDLLRLVGRTRGVFQDWVNALQANQPALLAVPALLAAVDRVAQGQALDVELAQDVVAVEMPEVVVEAAAGAAAESGTEAEAAVGTNAEWPLPLLDETEPERAAVAEIEENIAEAADESEPVGAAPVEAVGSQPEMEQARAETPALDVGAIIEYAVPCAPPAATESTEPEVTDDICIGSICLSTGLYEIFMTEAQQRLAELQEEAERHAEVANTPVCEHARRAVHTLGGIAGTAGIAPVAAHGGAGDPGDARHLRADVLDHDF
ncbi:MAG TPA: Hpt domain-containing protein, partial [Thiobacillus sp.]